MHLGAKPSHHSCTLVRHVASPPATTNRQGTSPPPADTRSEACGRSVTNGCAGSNGRARGEPRRAARLHPKPGRPGAWDQPLHTPEAAPIHRDDRDALGRRADTGRRARASCCRATADGTATTRAYDAGTQAGRPTRGREAHPPRALRRQEPSPDRREPGRRAGPDGAWWRAVVAVDGPAGPANAQRRLATPVAIRPGYSLGAGGRSARQQS